MVPGVSPASVTVWLVTSDEFSVEANPYPVVVPKFTSEVDAWSVVQVITAEVLVMLEADTAEITGPGAVVPGVVKLDGKGQIKPVPAQYGQECD